MGMKYVFAVLLLAGLALAEPDSTPEAEADPAADAWYGYYGRGYGYGGYGLGYRGYYGRKKRSAEADPAVLAVTHSAPAVATLVHPYGYALGYGYGLHHAPTVGYTVEHKAIEHIPGAVTAVAGEPTVVHVAAPYGYGYGHGFGYGYGLHHPLLVAAPAAAEAAVTDARKKREADPEAEAEAEADPAVLYSGYYGHPYARGYGLGGYYGGYGGYAGRGYYGYGYGRGYGGYAYYG